jgi:hypothetical protein
MKSVKAQIRDPIIGQVRSQVWNQVWEPVFEQVAHVFISIRMNTL